MILFKQMCDKKQWIKVERLYKAGVRSDPDHAPLPKRLSEVDDFLKRDERVQSRKSEGERLLDKINRASGKTPQ